MGKGYLKRVIMKKILLFAFVISLLGTGAELLLLEHFEGFWQLIPLVLIGLGLLALFWFRSSASTASTHFFRGLMLVFMISGVVGFVQHFQGNMAFELEMYPSMSGWKLIWETLKGATPVLAPGTMIATGLVGWAYTLK
jgi:predicted membrane protein